MADTTTRYYYDDQRVVLETDYDSSGPSESDLRYFIYGNYIDEVLVMHDCSSGNDYYYGHDHLFSPVVLYNLIGTISERYEYDALPGLVGYADVYPYLSAPCRDGDHVAV